MVGPEQDPPYNRPALSKERLRSEVADEAVVFHPAEYYREKQIELLLGRKAVRVDSGARSILLENGDALQFEKALFATGAAVRRLNGGRELPGVHYLRSLADCRVLNEVLQARPRVLVLGTGFIGCEVAASASALGCDVTLVGRTPPLAHVLGEEIGQIYSGYHRDNGVTVKSGVTVERFEGGGCVEKALLSDGTAVECDVGVIGIGVAPVLDIFQQEAIELRNGVVVNEFCESSVPGVYAAGDIAFSWNPRYQAHLRVEHFDNAQHQGTAAAKVMLGRREAYNPIPSFWSDQFDYKLQYRGYAPVWDAVVIRGKPDDASFTAFYVKDAKLQAVCSINRYKENYASRKLIGKVVDQKALQDDTADVKTLVEAT